MRPLDYFAGIGGIVSSLAAAFGSGTIGVGFGIFASGQALRSRAEKVIAISRFMLPPDADIGCAEVNDRLPRSRAPVAGIQVAVGAYRQFFIALRQRCGDFKQAV